MNYGESMGIQPTPFVLLFLFERLNPLHEETDVGEGILLLLGTFGGGASLFALRLRTERRVVGHLEGEAGGAPIARRRGGVDVDAGVAQGRHRRRGGDGGEKHRGGTWTRVLG